MEEYDYENYFGRKEKHEHSIRKAGVDARFLLDLKDVRTLNIGSGFTAKKQTPHIKEIVCGDISETIVKKLKDEGMEAVCFDARKKWPFKDEEFEQIIAIDIFEHLGQITNFMNELKRVLKKNGLVVIGIPLLNNWRNYLKLILMSTYNVQYDEHPRMFFDSDMKRLFSENGFLLEKKNYLGMKGYGYYHFRCKK